MFGERGTSAFGWRCVADPLARAPFPDPGCGGTGTGLSWSFSSSAVWIRLCRRSDLGRRLSASTAFAVATALGLEVAIGWVASVRGGLLRRRDERLGLGEGAGWEVGSFTLGEEVFLDLGLGLVATRVGRAMAMLRGVMLPWKGTESLGKDGRGQLTSERWRLSALERTG